MAECLVEMGRIGEANDLIVVAMNMRNMLDKESQRRVADRLCIVYAKLGEWEKAFEIADDAKKEGCYFDMAKQAIMVGELDIARKAAYPAFTHLKLDTGRYIFKLSFPEVAELFREMGDTQQAVEILNRSLAYLEGSKIGGYWLGDELAGSAAVFIKMDEKAETLKLLRKAFESAIREGDTMLKIDLLLKIAEIYVENQIPAAEVFITAKAPDA